MSRTALARDGRREGHDIRLVYVDPANQIAFPFLHIIIAAAAERTALVATTRWDGWLLHARAAKNPPTVAQIARGTGE
jgi:hypothetical protein